MWLVEKIIIRHDVTIVVQDEVNQAITLECVYGCIGNGMQAKSAAYYYLLHDW